MLSSARSNITICVVLFLIILACGKGVYGRSCRQCSINPTEISNGAVDCTKGSKAVKCESVFDYCVTVFKGTTVIMKDCWGSDIGAIRCPDCTRAEVCLLDDCNLRDVQNSGSRTLEVRLSSEQQQNTPNTGSRQQQQTSGTGSGLSCYTCSEAPYYLNKGWAICSNGSSVTVQCPAGFDSCFKVVKNGMLTKGCYKNADSFDCGAFGEQTSSYSCQSNFCSSSLCNGGPEKKQHLLALCVVALYWIQALLN